MNAGAWSKTPESVTLTLTSQVNGKNLTLTAPIDAADLTIDEAGCVLTMSLGIDRTKTGNFLLDLGLIGFLSSYGAKELMFVGSGPSGVEPLLVGGVATSGRVAVDLELVLDLSALAGSDLELNVSGTAAFEEVDVSIPGIGKLSDLTLQVQAQIQLTPVA